MFAFSYGFCQCLEDQGQQNNKSEEYFSKFPHLMGVISLTITYLPGVKIRSLGGSEGKTSACSEGDPGLILHQEDPLEKEMATHSSTLAWKIPWTEEPGRI